MAQTELSLPLHHHLPMMMGGLGLEEEEQEEEEDGRYMPCVDPLTGEVYMAPVYLVSVTNRRSGSNLQKRPLGRLESESRYTPRQPVLSCRTLDIDKSGSRTYRARSTSAIIEEQHRLLHSVYLHSRESKAQSPRGSRRQTPQHQCELKRRRFLTINGRSPQRPWTSVERQPSASKPSGRKKRPHTTTGAGRESPRKAATDTHLHLEVDPAVERSARALHSTQQRVRDLWREDSHSLDEGVFVRGRDFSAAGGATEPQGSGQWLNFAGRTDGDGLIQAFTSAMKGDGEYYTIDGSVGSHVARQLRKGDRIRVGVNGNVKSSSLRVRNLRHSRTHVQESIQEVPSEEEENTRTSPDGDSEAIVPLCWNDQVTREDAKVLEPRVPVQPRAKPSLCETKPVVFHKLVPEDQPTLARLSASFRGSKQTWSSEGFAVRARTKSRVGIDGTTTHPITSLSIEQRAADNAEEIDRLSVDDVLEKKLQGRDRKKRPDVAIPALTNLNSHPESGGARRRAIQTPPTSARSGKGELLSPPPSRASGGPWTTGGGDGRSVRPLTAHSAHSIDQNFDSFVVTSAASTSGKPSSARSGGRATSGKRPPPAKPTLHKSAAARGASISRSRNGDNTSYIQITQSLTAPSPSGLPVDQAGAAPQSIPPPTPASPSLSMGGENALDQDLSADEYPELDSDLEEAIKEAEMRDSNAEEEEEVREFVPEAEVANSADDGRRSGSRSGLNDENAASQNAGDRPPTASSNADIRYAFDIPTADQVEDEEAEEEAAPLEKQTLHDRLVEQTADLLAGAILGADLGADLSTSGRQEESPALQERNNQEEISYDDPEERIEEQQDWEDRG